MKKIIIIPAASLLLITLGACNKKSEEPAKTETDAAAPAEPVIPSDPAIDPKALLGFWKQTVDDTPNLYTFMEDGKCKGKELTDDAPRDCTYEIKTPDKTGTRFNTLIINYPASGDNEEYYTKRNIRVSGDKLEFPDDEGNVSEFNKYQKADPNAAPAKADAPEEAAAENNDSAVSEEDTVGKTTENDRIVIRYTGSGKGFGNKEVKAKSQYYVLDGFKEDGSLNAIKAKARIWYFFDDAASYDAAIEQYGAAVKDKNSTSHFISISAGMDNSWTTYSDIVAEIERKGLSGNITTDTDYELIR